MIIKNKSLYIKFKSVENLNNLKQQIISALKIDPKLIVNLNSKNKFLTLELINSKHSLEFDIIDGYNKSIRPAMASILGIGVEIMKCPEELVIVREDLENMKTDYLNMKADYSNMKTDYDLKITNLETEHSAEIGELREKIKVLKDIIDKLN